MSPMVLRPDVFDGTARDLPSKAMWIPEWIEECKLSLFNDQNRVGMARVPVEDHFETYSLGSKKFRNWMIRRFLRQGRLVSKRFLGELLSLFEALADDRTFELSNRSSWDAQTQSLWIDLSDDRWRAVLVSKNGWTIQSTPPALFRRFAHQQALPEPELGGNLNDLWRYLPALASEVDKLLVSAWLVAALMPIPRPILTLIGPHGAAKSTFSRFLRRLIDPSRVELLGRDARADLPLIFEKHAVAPFDNADALSPNESDLFCQAVTGRAFARRQLYTDSGEVIFEIKRAVIINGLQLPTNRPDFLDRALIVDVERVTNERRQLEQQLDTAFMEARPRLLGALLTTISRVLSALPRVSRDGLNRMADFHLWGRGFAEVVGLGAAKFDEAFQQAELRQKRGAFDNTLALALLLFARQVRRWQGDATSLLRSLHEIAKANQIRQSPEFWPDTPMALGRQLKHLSDSLARNGVRMTHLRRATSRQLVVEYDQKSDQIGDDD